MRGDKLTLTAERCSHGVWHPHNALKFDSGVVMDDPEGPCEGGKVTVDGETTYGISPALAMFLARVDKKQWAEKKP